MPLLIIKNNQYRIMKLLCYCLLGMTLFSCSEPELGSPEQAIQNTLLAMEEAAEERTLSGFMQHISDDYQDRQGNRKKDIRRIIQIHYIRNQKIHILSKVQSLEINGSLAKVELSTAMAGREADLSGEFLSGETTGLSGLRANTHHFTIQLVSDDQQQTWLVKNVSWKRGWE